MVWVVELQTSILLYRPVYFPTHIPSPSLSPTFLSDPRSTLWRRGCAVVNAFDFRSGGRCFEASPCQRVVSLDKILCPTLSLFTQVYKWVPATYCWGVTLRWTGIPSRGRVAILSVASCYGNRDKLRPCGPPWPECDFILYPVLSSQLHLEIQFTTFPLSFLLASHPLL